MKHWHRRGGIGWLLYEGNRVIWEDATVAGLMAWARGRGIRSERCSLWLARF